MRDDSDLQMHYCRHMRIHALLTCCGGQVKMEDGAKGGKLAVGRWQPAVGNRQSGSYMVEDRVENCGGGSDRRRRHDVAVDVGRQPSPF
jgi:hypothetical protein